MAIWDFLNSQRGTAANYAPLTDEHRKRVQLFGAYWDYYRGKQRRPLRIKDGQADDNVIVNYSRRIVDKSTAFLFGDPPEFEIDHQDNMTTEGTDDALEAWLHRCWGTDEQRGMLLQEMSVNGGVCGTSFVRIYPPDRPGDLPRIVALNPSLLDIVTNPDDIDDVVSYTITWQSGKDWKRHRIDAQENGTWVITEEIARTGDTWVMTAETLHPFTWSPVFWCQNRVNPVDVWGISDLEEADINDAINFTASNINRILRYHAHPRTIGTGFTAASLQNTAVDQFWTIPAEGARVTNLEMQSDLASACILWSCLREAYAKISGVPDLDPEKVNVGALSGFALRILYSDLIELTNVKRNTYGEMLAGINSALLELGGFGAGIDVSNKWHDPLPVDQAAQVQLLALDRQQGLSLETYLEQRGYDAERELERIQNERAENATLGEALLGAFERGAVGAVMNTQQPQRVNGNGDQNGQR